MEHILDLITGDEPWILEALRRLELDGDVYEVSSRRVAIMEALGLIQRDDNFGLSYSLTKKGTMFIYEPNLRSSAVSLSKLLLSTNKTVRPVCTNRGYSDH